MDPNSFYEFQHTYFDDCEEEDAWVNYLDDYDEEFCP